jgi:hypothetical protein
MSIERSNGSHSRLRALAARAAVVGQPNQR